MDYFLHSIVENSFMFLSSYHTTHTHWTH